MKIEILQSIHSPVEDELKVLPADLLLTRIINTNLKKPISQIYV